MTTSMVSRSEPVVCAGGDPPTCCQPAPVPADRLELLLAVLRERMPTRCPHCSKPGPAPAFIRGCDAWMCSDWRCARVFMVED